jgi:hypothetical protein
MVKVRLFAERRGWLNWVERIERRGTERDSSVALDEGVVNINWKMSEEVNGDADKKTYPLVCKPYASLLVQLSRSP